MAKHEAQLITSVEALPLVLCVRDVASVLQISRQGAYNLVNSKEFPSGRIGRRIIVTKSAFLSWLDSHN